MIDLELLDRDGFTVVDGIIDSVAVDSLIEILSSIALSDAAIERGGRAYASRNLLRDPRLHALAGSHALRALVEPVLGPKAFAVRGLLFDKTAEVNWMVPWHQDLSIAVKRKMNAPGFGPWTVKSGVPHVQPPIEVLERMVAVRLHLDDCSEAAGPLRVVAGSHRSGKLGAEQTRDWLERVGPVSCPVPSGGALVLRPLLLHASSATDAPGHRRVIHLEYAADPLPDGVEWYENDRVAPGSLV